MKNIRNIRNPIFFVSILAFAASAGLYAYLYSQTVSLVSHTLEARKILNDNEIALAQSSEIAALYQSTAERRARLSSYFVPVEDAVDVIRAIESIGDSSGASVVISALRNEPPAEETEKVGKVTATVAVKGAWKDVMQALELFETLPYLKKIKDVSLSVLDTGEEAEKSHVWQLRFDISVSSLKKT